jgi:hypothetical protein
MPIWSKFSKVYLTAISGRHATATCCSFLSMGCLGPWVHRAFRRVLFAAETPNNAPDGGYCACDSRIVLRGLVRRRLRSSCSALAIARLLGASFRLSAFGRKNFHSRKYDRRRARVSRRDAMVWRDLMPLIAAACLIMLIVAPDDWLLWVIGAIISGSVSATYVRLVMLRHEAGLTG